MNQTLLGALGSGFRLGVSFGFLDLFLGSDLSVGLWSNAERMPGFHYAVLAMATSTSLSILLAAGVFLVQRVVPRARALDPVGLTAACLSACFLLTVVSFKSRTLFTLWFEWRSVFVALSLVYGFCAIAFFELLSRRPLRVLRNSSPAVLFGVAAYAPIDLTWVRRSGCLPRHPIVSVGVSADRRKPPIRRFRRVDSGLCDGERDAPTRWGDSGSRAGLHTPVLGPDSFSVLVSHDGVHGSERTCRRRLRHPGRARYAASGSPGYLRLRSRDTAPPG